jgi:hypothetical protein
MLRSSCFEYIQKNYEDSLGFEAAITISLPHPKALSDVLFEEPNMEAQLHLCYLPLLLDNSDIIHHCNSAVFGFKVSSSWRSVNSQE